VCRAGKFARRSLVQRGGERPSDLHLYIICVSHSAQTRYNMITTWDGRGGKWQYCRVLTNNIPFCIILNYTDAALTIDSNNTNNIIRRVPRTRKLHIGTHYCAPLTNDDHRSYIITAYARRRRSVYKKTCCAPKKGCATFARGLQAAAAVAAIITQHCRSYINTYIIYYKRIYRRILAANL